MHFSIIIPTYNPVMDDIYKCVSSAQSQNYPSNEFEILLVDDKSNNWLREINGTVAQYAGVDVIRSEVNGGAGSARNIGLEHATGDWVIFLDSDDILQPNALLNLTKFILANPNVDLVGFDWAFTDNSLVNQRKDGNNLNLPKRELTKKYLKLHMDGSVIYTAIKRDLIERNGILFNKGLHEDIKFIFEAYYQAEKTAYLHEILYLKNNREGSIVNTISESHIDGYIRAWEDIKSYLLDEGEYFDAYIEGTVNVIGTRVREIYRHTHESKRYALLQYLLKAMPQWWKKQVIDSKLDTQFAKIAKQFIADGEVDSSMFKRTWSCTDLQGSLFLAPNEVRTCCKRFFVDGEMKGDVKLVDAKDATPGKILEAKKSLIASINKGEKNDCSGCNFMEFKEWEPIEPLKIKYLSMEHHSVCNMKCSYCSDEYYGGKKAEYDVLGLVKNLSDNGSLDNLHTTVWGGGEPTVGKDFNDILSFLDNHTNSKHRILTNSLKYSHNVQESLDDGIATIVTSIDAGTQETFTKVRGMGKLETVLNNLKLYSLENPHLITIKYIFTEDNSTSDEIISYVKLIAEYGLTECNFQISVDFKQEESTIEQLKCAIDIHSLLRQVGCKVVFLDDLAMQRLNKLTSKLPEHQVFMHLTENPYIYKSIVIFGTGEMTKWMLKHSLFLTKCNIHIEGFERYVKDVSVLITGSQGYGDAYRRAIACGVPEYLIIKGVVL